jgi:hypothetical protein
MNGSLLAERVIDGRSYWSGPSQTARPHRGPLAHLLPTYDEYVIGYKNRDSLMDRSRSARIAIREEFGQFLIVDGTVKGYWKRTLTAAGSTLEIRPRRRLSAEETTALHAAAARYSRFLAMPVSVVVRR